MKILEQLWYDKIEFCQRKTPETDEALRLKSEILKDSEKFTQMLPLEANELLEKIMNNQGELSSLIECDTFLYGFRLGARIMLEAMDETSI